MGAARVGLPAEAGPFSFVLLRGGRALSGCWDPQCSPRRVWWSSPAAAEDTAVGQRAGGSGSDAFTGGSFSSWQHQGPSGWGGGSDICTTGCWRPSRPLGMEAAGTSPDLQMHPALPQPWSPSAHCPSAGQHQAGCRQGCPSRGVGALWPAPRPPLGERRSAPRSAPAALGGHHMAAPPRTEAPCAQTALPQRQLVPCCSLT